MVKGNPVCPDCGEVLQRIKGLYVPHYSDAIGETNLIQPYICTKCWVPEHPEVR